MSGSGNPDLLPPGAQGSRVQATTAITQPIPVVITDPKYYSSTMQTVRLHLPDGTPIPFVNGFFETPVKAIQDYLDSEIALRHISGYVSHATEAEIATFMQRKDPVNFFKKEAREQLEDEMRAKLEAEIAERLGLSVEDVRQGPVSEIAADVGNMVGTAAGVLISTKAGATVGSVAGEVVGETVGEAVQLAEDTAIAGVDALKRRLGIGTAVDAGGAKVTVLQPDAAQMLPARPVLQGIQSSADIKDASQGSASSNGGQVSA